MGFGKGILKLINNSQREKKEELHAVCFIRYPETSKMVLKKSAAPRFSTHLSDETLRVIFDMVGQK